MNDQETMAASGEATLGGEMGQVSTIRLDQTLKIEIPNPEYLGGPPWTVGFTVLPAGAMPPSS